MTPSFPTRRSSDLAHAPRKCADPAFGRERGRSPFYGSAFPARPVDRRADDGRRWQNRARCREHCLRRAGPQDALCGELEGYRSEERRVGKECGRKCRSQWAQFINKKHGASTETWKRADTNISET